MRKFLVAAFVLLPIASATAADWPKVDDYVAIGECPNDWCRSTRETWEKNYSAAISGDYQGQRNVAYCLSDGCEGAIRVNPVLGCAWRMVILESGHLEADQTDTTNLKYFCGREKVDAAGLATAKAQARRMLKMLDR